MLYHMTRLSPENQGNPLSQHGGWAHTFQQWPNGRAERFAKTRWRIKKKKVTYFQRPIVFARTATQQAAVNLLLQIIKHVTLGITILVIGAKIVTLTQTL